MTEEELSRIEQQHAEADVSNAMHSGCTDYACHCHFKIPDLVAEIRRLRTAAGIPGLLSNCPHQEKGWCLACVSDLCKQVDVARDQCRHAWSYYYAMRDELNAAKKQLLGKE